MAKKKSRSNQAKKKRQLALARSMATASAAQNADTVKIEEADCATGAVASGETSVSDSARPPMPPVDEADAVLASLAADTCSGCTKKKKKKKRRGGGGATSGGAATKAADGGTASGASNELDDFMNSLGGEEGTSKKKKKKKKKDKKKNDVSDGDKEKVAPKKKKLSKMAQLAQQRQAERKRLEEEEAERKRLEEEEEKRLLAEEAAAEEKRRLKKERARARKEALKKSGDYMTKKQKEELKRKQERLAKLGIKVDESDLKGKSGSSSRKRVNYGRKKFNKKKQGKNREQVAPVVVAPVAVPVPEPVTPVPQQVAAKESEPAVKDDDDSGADWENDDWDDSNLIIATEEVDKTLLEPEAPKVKVVQPKKPVATKEKKKSKLSKKEKRKLKQKQASASSASSSRDAVDEHEELMTKSKARRRQNLLEARTHGFRRKAFRSPIVCVMGHVDTGKTKLLDKMRRSNVQDGEAGGITQQIGATFFPKDSLLNLTSTLLEQFNLQCKLPGLLTIDTPGHESFSNLRGRGSSVCDIAILVVDIMHGLEPQTLESLKMLKDGNTPFVVALNKVDRCYEWKKCINKPIREALSQQKNYTIDEFRRRADEVIVQFKEKGYNAALYWENTSSKDTISLVPTSAHSGEGVPDLLTLMIQLSQVHLWKKLTWINYVQCTVLEVKVIEGLGTTIDVVLVNGSLNVGDTIVVCGLNGPIVTTIRALLTPRPMKEIRVKTDYVKHDRIQGSMGIKIACQDVEKACAGTSLMVLQKDDYAEHIKAEVMKDLAKVESLLQKTGRGVFVQASTLGSLEALLVFLRELKPPIPVSGFNIGPVHKKDVMQAAVMLEHRKEFATILAFDVKIDRDATDLAKEMGVKIFKKDIIYHLFDAFTAYLEELDVARREGSKHEVVFPCILEILPDHIYARKNPIIMGVKVISGIVKPGTPMCVIKKSPETGENSVLTVGRITSIQINSKEAPVAKTGQEVCVKIEQNAEQNHIAYKRHFTEEDNVYSVMTRPAIDILKRDYKDELTKADWQLVVRLKSVFGIL